MDASALLNIDLAAVYSQFNHQYFEATLPPCRIEWSRRLTRAAGNIDVRRRHIKLSVPLLVDAYRSTSLFGPEFAVCGVVCASPQRALEEILKHEMIHLWLHVQGLPSGHTPEFRAKAKAIGQPKTRHGIALPVPKSGWTYWCPMCRTEFTRRRRYGRAVACAKCCKQWNKGQYDERFKLRGRKINV
jgi:predicted SprT family Zn-dependent metalloprotease